MNKKVLLKVTPLILMVCALTGCKKEDPEPKVKELTKIEVSTTISSSTYEVGYEFEKSDLNVLATWSDGSFNTVKKEDYTVSPELPYKFVVGDVDNGKDFTITYQNKSQGIHVYVKDSVQNVTVSYSTDVGSYISSDIGKVSAGSKFKGMINYDKDSKCSINRIGFLNKDGDTYTDVGFSKTNTFYVTSIYDKDKKAITASVGEDGLLNLPEAYEKKVFIEFTITKDISTEIYLFGNQSK